MRLIELRQGCNTLLQGSEKLIGILDGDLYASPMIKQLLRGCADGPARRPICGETSRRSTFDCRAQRYIPIRRPATGH
ncbi:hypothetical protein D3C84_1108460 [compost metagenome]